MRTGGDLLRKNQAVNPTPISGAPLPLQEGQGELRAGVGLSKHGGGGLSENLASRQVRRLLREIGVADGAVGGGDVLEGNAKAADRGTDREALECAEAAAKLRDLLGGLVENLLRRHQVAAGERVGLARAQSAQVTDRGVAEAAGSDRLDANAGLVVLGHFGAHGKDRAAASDLEAVAAQRVEGRLESHLDI